MKRIFISLFAIAALSVGSMAADVTAVLLEDQHGNYTTLFVAAPEPATSVALMVHHRGISQDEEVTREFNTQPESIYRSR